MNMIQVIKNNIIKALASLVKDKIGLVDLVYPETADLGDLSLPIFKFAKELKKAPREIAKELADKLNQKKPKLITKVEAARGYVNFFVDYEEVAKKLMNEIASKKDKFGDTAKKGRAGKVLIEFVSPNSNKPLHLGHLRNAALGEATSRLLETQGLQVTRANLVNDRGIHICKAMVAYNHFGGLAASGGKVAFDSPKRAGLKGDHFVGKYYVMYEQKRAETPKLEKEAQDCLKKWEANDPKTIKLWKVMREWVVRGFDETYKILGLRFDRTDLESDIWQAGKDIVTKGLRGGVFIRDTGAVLAKLEKFGLPPKVLLRSDGTSLYITTDLALAAKRYVEEKFDKLIYVVGSEQDLYFKQLFAIFKLLKAPYAEGARHLSYGMVFLPEGKMKSREGTVIDADDLIAKLQDYARVELQARHDFLAKEELDRRSRVIALAALKYYLLAVNPPSSMHYDPRESLSFTGKTGPYLLYTLARMKSILKKSTPTSILPLQTGGGRRGLKSKVFWKYLKEKEEGRLILEMAKFSEVIERAATTLDPEELATYLYNLAKLFSDFYEKYPVLQATAYVSQARQTLVEACKIVLEKGLYLLGIETLDEM